jgi:Leucine-rich repeat (LRR) protein
MSLIYAIRMTQMCDVIRDDSKPCSSPAKTKVKTSKMKKIDLKVNFNTIRDHGYFGIIIEAIATEPCEINSIKGEHMAEKSIKDVDTLYILNSENFYYIPSGLAKFFPNLRALVVSNCGLKEIKADDLMGLNHLETLHINDTKLASLPDNLLNHTKNLTDLTVENCKIESLSSQLLNVIPDEQWTSIYFRGNTRIDLYFDPEESENSQDLNILKMKMDLLTKPEKVSSATIELDISDASTSQSTQKSQASSEFKKLLELKELCDFTVVVGTKKIPVHKVALAIRSSVFADMFKTIKNVGKFEINDHSEVLVENFLQSLYSLEVESEGNAMELFELAAKFNIPELKSIYEKVAIKNISSSNALEVLKFGNTYKSDAMIEAAFDKIKSQNPGSIKSNALKRKPDDVEMIVNLQNSIKKAKLTIEQLNSEDLV